MRLIGKLNSYGLIFKTSSGFYDINPALKAYLKDSILSPKIIHSSSKLTFSENETNTNSNSNLIKSSEKFSHKVKFYSFSSLENNKQHDAKLTGKNVTDDTVEYVDTLMDGLAELQSENEKLKSQNEKLEKQLKEKNDKLIQVIEENEQLKKQLEEIKKQVENMINKIEKIEKPNTESKVNQINQDILETPTYKSKIDYKA